MPKGRPPPAAGSKASKPAARKPPKFRSGPQSGAAPSAGAAEPKKPAPSNRGQKAVPYNLQQRLLDVFGTTLASTLASPHLSDALQALKRSLFERDFAGAFGGVDNTRTPADQAGNQSTDGHENPPTPGDISLLDAYAARWSPTRALCYASVLGSPLVQEQWQGESSETERPLRLVAIGGGAAETVAFGALLAAGEPGEPRTGDLLLVDSGPWASLVDRLHASMIEPGAYSRYPALVGPAERFGVAFRQLDILKVDDEEMSKIIGGAGGEASSPPTTLVTLFFTLNELFTAGGLGAAATFLLRLTTAASSGTVLLVVDSPGSYAETAVGAQSRRYPMRWLLDKFLLQDSGGWTKVHDDESVWFRLPASLSYPVRLEDMRYQMHLYVRT